MALRRWLTRIRRSASRDRKPGALGSQALGLVLQYIQRGGKRFSRFVVEQLFLHLALLGEEEIAMTVEVRNAARVIGCQPAGQLLSLFLFRRGAGCPSIHRHAEAGTVEGPLGAGRGDHALRRLRRIDAQQREEVLRQTVDVAACGLQIGEAAALMNELLQHLGEAILLQVRGQDGDRVRQAALAVQRL